MQGRILVVDDNPAMCDLLREILEADGHRIDKATDADLALSMCKMTKYDLIMSDIMMPLMSGIQLIKKIQESRWNGRPAFILMTGSLPEDVARELSSINVFALLRKPFALNAMCDTVRRAVEFSTSQPLSA